jgi:hypothetical protein
MVFALQCSCRSGHVARCKHLSVVQMVGVDGDYTHGGTPGANGRPVVCTGHSGLLASCWHPAQPMQGWTGQLQRMLLVYQTIAPILTQARPAGWRVQAISSPMTPAEHPFSCRQQLVNCMPQQGSQPLQFPLQILQSTRPAGSHHNLSSTQASCSLEQAHICPAARTQCHSVASQLVIVSWHVCSQAQPSTHTPQLSSQRQHQIPATTGRNLNMGCSWVSLWQTTATGQARQ